MKNDYLLITREDANVIKSLMSKLNSGNKMSDDERRNYGNYLFVILYQSIKLSEEDIEKLS